MKWRLQVVVPDSLESVVAVEIVAADVICRVGNADPSEGHRAQLGREFDDLFTVRVGGVQ